MERQRSGTAERLVQIPAGGVTVEGDLRIPQAARGIVAFAHESGTSRFSLRNRSVAGFLEQAGLATLLMDLLTPDEEGVDELTAKFRFDIGLLATRLVAATDWLTQQRGTRHLALGYFGASTGAAAALVAAAKRADTVRAVVSQGGRPDLAGPALPRVRAPTLLIVGSRDEDVIELNRAAFERLRCDKVLEIVPGDLFEEPGTLERVAWLARDWFVRYLAPTGTGRAATRTVSRGEDGRLRHS